MKEVEIVGYGDCRTKESVEERRGEITGTDLNLEVKFGMLYFNRNRCLGETMRAVVGQLWRHPPLKTEMKNGSFRNIFFPVSVTETKILSCSHSSATSRSLQNSLMVSLKP